MMTDAAHTIRYRATIDQDGTALIVAAAAGRAYLFTCGGLACHRSSDAPPRPIVRTGLTLMMRRCVERGAGDMRAGGVVRARWGTFGRPRRRRYALVLLMLA